MAIQIDYYSTIKSAADTDCSCCGGAGMFTGRKMVEGGKFIRNSALCICTLLDRDANFAISQIRKMEEGGDV